MKRLTILLIAGLLALAGLLTLIVGIARTQAVERDVVINEVAWMGTAASSSDEWIELYNNTNSDIALTNWTLKATDDTPNITLTGTIPAKGYFLLERTDDNTVSDIAADLIYSGSLENGGEDLELRDGDDNLIDSLNCETAGDWYAGDNSTKQTMERKVPTASGTEATNWADNDGLTVNGLDANGDPLKATPKAQNSALVGVDGSGAATISPIYGEVEIAGTWTITYTATQDISGGRVAIDIPTG